MNLTEKVLENRVDIKYYRAVTSLLEKGYLLNDISAALLMALTENKAKGSTHKTEPKRNAKVQKPKVNTKKAPQKQSNTAKKNNTGQKRKTFKPNKRKVKNENSNS